MRQSVERKDLVAGQWYADGSWEESTITTFLKFSRYDEETEALIFSKFVGHDTYIGRGNGSVTFSGLEDSPFYAPTQEDVTTYNLDTI